VFDQEKQKHLQGKKQVRMRCFSLSCGAMARFSVSKNYRTLGRCVALVWASSVAAQATDSGTAGGDAGVTDLMQTTSGTPEPEKVSPISFGAYAEAFYQWNLGNPSNGITHFRGFDNRHNTFTLANVAIDAQWDFERLVGRVALQVGHTPSTYYASEPELPGASASNGSGAALWKYVQQAYAGYRFGVGRGLTVSAGLFLSPIGPESMAIKDNWNWSRSNLFFGLPFYHTGVRASYPVNESVSLTVAGYNGWNSVVDNNPEKSVSVQAVFNRPTLTLSVLYFGGVERSKNAPEGRPWRHLFDAHLTWHPKNWLSLLAHLNGGFEMTRFGATSWMGGALYARLKLRDPLSITVRADVLAESVADNGSAKASALFFPAPWVASATATVEYRPLSRVSLRLEYRQDIAATPLYFRGAVEGDGVSTPFRPNTKSQDTLTLGMASWF
jgi:Putative beta-barrel porin-2, OmpL-like. bbp2